VTAAVAGAPSLAGAHAARRPAAIVALASVEARRLVLHPAYLAVAGYVVIGTGVGAAHAFADVTRKNTGELIGLLFLLYLPLIATFAGSLVASSARRAGADEMLAALPVTVRSRSAALVLASLGPAALGGVAAAAVWYLQRDVPDASIPVQGAALLGTPLLYIGITCLALAAARWLPWPGVPVGIVIGLFAWVATARSSSHAALVLTAPWLAGPDEAAQERVIAGYSDVWHLVYLIGLIGLAATAALFRDNLRRMVMVGAAIGAPTVVAGWAQLP
jgi:hypothetical protein